MARDEWVSVVIAVHIGLDVPVYYAFACAT